MFNVDFRSLSETNALRPGDFPSFVHWTRCATRNNGDPRAVAASNEVFVEVGMGVKDWPSQYGWFMMVPNLENDPKNLVHFLTFGPMFWTFRHWGPLHLAPMVACCKVSSIPTVRPRTRSVWKRWVPAVVRQTWSMNSFWRLKRCANVGRRRMACH